MTASDRDLRETLNRIRKQADAATEGPWRHISIFEVGGFVEDSHGRELFDWAQDDAGTICAPDPDAEFIAAARTTVPWLLEQVELRDKALDAVRALHFERAELACGNPTHTVPDLMCPDCLTVCDDCGAPWPCATVEAITATIEGETRA